MPLSSESASPLLSSAPEGSTRNRPSRMMVVDREEKLVLPQLQGVHPPQVAGLFYPNDQQVLGYLIDELLTEAAARIPAPTSPRPAPKALIVPHAGYIYSGPIAASGYVQLQRADCSHIKRVVLLGPAHRHGFPGIAACRSAAFETPLGSVPVDSDGVIEALSIRSVQLLNTAHVREHSLEVQLPFLQRTLQDFSIVPLVVGMTTSEHVRQVLSRLWGGPETLIVISSDLSHFHSASVAAKLDLETARMIESGRVGELKGPRACGHLAIAGLLCELERRNARHDETRLGLERLDLRNSSQTAGSKDRVVGYGAWQIRPVSNGDAVVDPGDRLVTSAPRPASPTAGSADESLQSVEPSTLPLRPRTDLTPEMRTFLVRTALTAIQHPLQGHGELQVHADSAPATLRSKRSTFVTLKTNGQLRGCIGTVLPKDPLIVSVAKAASNAAFRDRRFRPVTAQELPHLELSIAVLSPTEPLKFSSEAELLSQLRPHVDGLILRDAGRQSVFLPAVWDQLTTPEIFLQRLKVKAGLRINHWSNTIKIERFTVETIHATQRNS